MTTEELLARSVLNSWKLVIGRVDQLAASLSDEQLQQEVAPGRNRPIYLIGHLTVTHDLLFPLLRLGERLHPELDNAYLTNPDQTVPDPISSFALKKAWNEVNAKLTAAFESLTPAQWLERHNAVSEEDFAKEPLRNRLAVLMSRTNHASSHAGQILLALPSARNS